MSAPKKSHLSAVLACRPSPNRPGVRQYLIVPVKEDRHKPSFEETLEVRLKRLKSTPFQFKFPAGTNKNKRSNGDENPHQTAAREFQEETDLVLLSLWPNPIDTCERGPYHTQYFFVTGPNEDKNDWEGRLRDEIKIEVEPGRPDEVLYLPEWVDADVLMTRIFPSHRRALVNAEEAFDAMSDELQDQDVS